MAHHRVEQVYLRFAKHALEGSNCYARSFPLSALSRRDGFPVLVRLCSALRPVASGFVGEGSGVFRLVSLRLKAKIVRERPEWVIVSAPARTGSSVRGAPFCCLRPERLSLT
jgi:hypothetical protein